MIMYRLNSIETVQAGDCGGDGDYNRVVQMVMQMVASTERWETLMHSMHDDMRSIWFHTARAAGLCRLSTEWCVITWCNFT
nr:hypothetical protein BaRGS_034664 [Batillaria attramentaria]